MFKKTPDGNEGNRAPGGEGGDDLSLPPLKPFSRKGSHTPSASSGPAAKAPMRPDVPRRVTEVPSASSRRNPERRRPGTTEDRKLIVGRDISLRGEITSCDKLVVEGQVEASLSDARIIEVTPSGFFKGSAHVGEADISGRYEGELIATEKLTVRSTGRVGGSVRYTKIVIEAGGEVSGDMRTLSQAEDEAVLLPNPHSLSSHGRDDAGRSSGDGGGDGAPIPALPLKSS